MSSVRQQQATAADIAASLGLSTTTVWRALRESPLVKEQTRQRVVQAAREAGFETNWIARSLRTQTSLFLGMVVSDVTHPFFASATEGAQDVFEQAGYQLLLMNSKRQAERETRALRTLLAHRAAGILLTTSGGYEPCGVPIVFIDNVAENAGGGRVLQDNHDGIGLLVQHLLEHGHTRIAYIGAPPLETSTSERLAGFHAALARAWLAVPPAYVGECDEACTSESARETTTRLLALDPAPTAIVASTDTIAVGALAALRAAGRRVPEDVALVSFDDPAQGALLDPAMTALTDPAHDIGAQAASLLLDQIDRPGPPVNLIVRQELLVRRSCGCEGSGRG
jgi:LacI family transcriptional regulator